LAVVLAEYMSVAVMVQKLFLEQEKVISALNGRLV
jgi:hypothetical protein